MNSNDLRELSIEQLCSKELEFKKELFNVKFQLHTGRLENTAKLPALKKDIARLKTILRQKRG
ncbi:MAG: 50S ribosomal protein L29 [Geobacteraceae bacterium]|jgi:large subunit ribosomal protein L29|nr:50S ribosomal protein L29 [Geobacteraceae bacterium]